MFTGRLTYPEPIGAAAWTVVSLASYDADGVLKPA
jgi:hypothetical protein